MHHRCGGFSLTFLFTLFIGAGGAGCLQSAGDTEPDPLPPREPESAAPETPLEPEASPEPEADAGVPSPDPTPEPAPTPEPTTSPATDGGVLADAGDLSDAGPPPPSLDVEWIAGAADCDEAEQVPLQVHQYSARTWILRQSKCTNFEGPFLFLLVGEERALLLDSGATQNANTVPVQETVEGILASHLDTWPNAPVREDFELIVAHTHGHGDHVAGDRQFEDEPNTVVIGTGQNAVRNFFDLDDWPDGVVTYDLGDRVLEVLPLPGHQNAHIAMYDPEERLLLTGDSLYPGNLFIQNFAQYRTSIDDLTLFAAERDVTWVLGTHIEMTATPGVDYPYGTTFQPNEHVLELTFAHLVELRDALQAMDGNGQREVHDDFIISP